MLIKEIKTRPIEPHNPTWKFIVHALKRLSLQLWTFFYFFYFLFKSFVKVELSYVFTINLFAIAENCTEKWISL